MANFSSYKGTIELISGITQANNGDFPLVESHAVQINNEGKRLDSMIQELLDVFCVSISVDKDSGSLNIQSNASMYFSDSIMLFNVYNEKEVAECLK